MRIPIRFDRGYARLSSLLWLRPSQSYLELDAGELTVKMGWGFRSRIACSAISAVTRSDERPLSRGVHGFGGRWLVNGSADGLVVLHLSPPQRAYVMGIPVRLRELIVSVEDPAQLADALAPRLR